MGWSRHSCSTCRFDSSQRRPENIRCDSSAGRSRLSCPRSSLFRCISFCRCAREYARRGSRPDKCSRRFASTCWTAVSTRINQSSDSAAISAICRSTARWWNFHPWFGQPVYYGIAGLVVAAAISALWIRRDALTLYLVALAVCAAFLGKGIRGPVGEPYWFGVRHIPIFGSLRGPNRWLIEQAFCYATLAALTLGHVYRRLQTPVTAGWPLSFSSSGSCSRSFPLRQR